MMIYARTDSPSVTDIDLLLLLQESQFEKFKFELNVSGAVSVNVAQGQGNGQNYNSDQYSNRGGRTSRGRGGRNFRGGRGRGRGPKPTCQLCYKYGHDAFNCQNKFDHDFVQPPLPPPPDDVVQNQGQNSAQTQNQASVNNQQPRAYVTTQSNVYHGATQEVQIPTPLDAQDWYPDSGATHHVTINPHNLAQGTSYHGADNVQIEMVKVLKITSIGSSKCFS